jgi:hypothetical protein
VHRRSIFLDDSACDPVRAHDDSRRTCSRLSRGGPAQAGHEAPQTRAAKRAVEWSACVASRAEPARCRNFRRRRCRLRLSPRRLWASTVLRPRLVAFERRTGRRGTEGKGGSRPALAALQGSRGAEQRAAAGLKGERTNLIRPLARLDASGRDDLPSACGPGASVDPATSCAESCTAIRPGRSGLRRSAASSGRRSPPIRSGRSRPERSP